MSLLYFSVLFSWSICSAASLNCTYSGKTIDRLRKIQKDDLVKTLGVVAQYEIQNGQLIAVESTQSRDDKKGVRVSDESIQFGLTKHEIKGVFDRMKRLLKRVDSGKITTF